MGGEWDGSRRDDGDEGGRRWGCETASAGQRTAAAEMGMRVLNSVFSLSRGRHWVSDPEIASTTKTSSGSSAATSLPV